MLGTGHHVFTQAGDLLPGRFSIFQIQPYLAAQFSFMDGLGDAMIMFEGGINWLVLGHHAKITTHYRNRPVFNANGTTGRRASEGILQVMIFI